MVFDGEIQQESFITWLCGREYEVVGHPGRCFEHPLACWLSEVFGHVVGIDEGRYGPACVDFCQWRLLPRWAVCFGAIAERRCAGVMLGSEAFVLMAEIEVRAGRGCR